MNNAIKSGLFALAFCCAFLSEAKIYSGEYFWNQDPGIGQATKIEGQNVTGDNMMDIIINTPSLSPGLNILGLRVFDGKWSPTVTNLVYIPSINNAPSTKGLCEYWWDTDPGVGDAVKTTFQTNGSGTVDLEMATTGLAPGIHILGLRAFIGERWSHTLTSLVFIAEDKEAKTEYVEYFWGDDPGYGKGIQLQVVSSEIVTLDDIDIPLPTGAVNDYKITVRARSTTGQWGPSYVKIFSLGSSVNVTLDKHKIEMEALGDKQNVNAVVTSDNIDWPRYVTWTSSDNSVATVDNIGNIRAVGKGECVIRAECLDSGAYDECDVTVTGTKIYLTDGETYSNSEDNFGVNVAYTRNFNNTNWQALYVPFNMSYEEWSPYAEVAELYNVRGYDTDNDGEIDDVRIEFNKLNGGEILPNIPYIVRAKSIGTFTFECKDKDLLSVPDTEGWVECSSTKYVYTFYGVYERKTDLVKPGLFFLSGGQFCYTTNPSTSLAPFRSYLMVTTKNGGYNGAHSTHKLPERISISIDGENISGIDDIIETNVPTDLNPLYDLTGRKVTNPRPGLYIQKGRKVIIK